MGKAAGIRKLREQVRALDLVVFLLAFSGVFMGVFFFSATHSRSTLLMPISGSILIIAGWLLYRFKYHASAFVVNRLFPVALIVLSLLYGFALMPGTTPDEPFHYRASYLYANLIANPANPYEVRAEDKDELENAGVLSSVINTENAQRIKDSQRPFASDSELVESDEFKRLVSDLDLTANPPQLKLPSAIGIVIAKAFNLSDLWLFYLGMLFNMAYGIALIIAAVRIIPVGKNILMTIALLPMTLHLLGSYSYDAGIIGLSFLLFALLLRAVLSDEKLNKKEYAALLIVACLLAPCKVLYTFMVFLALLIPQNRFKSKRQSYALKSVLVLLPFAVILLMRLPALISLAGMSAAAADGDTVASGNTAIQTFTVSDLVSRPGNTIKIMFGFTPIVLGWMHLSTLVGGSLGWLQQNILAPGYVVAILLIALLLSSLPSKDDNVILPGKMRVVLMTIFVACVLGVLVTFFMDLTPSNEFVIQGVQGRYYLPVLPLCLLALRSQSFSSNRCLGFSLLALLVCIDTTYMGYIYYVM